MDNDKNSNIAIVVAIIGAVALVAVPIVTRLVDLYIPPAGISSQEGVLPPQNTLTIALSDNFVGDGSYDTDIWTCFNECSIENIFLSSGVLNLQRDSEGWSSIISRAQWAYSDLNSLTGKFQINHKSSQYEVGWLSLAYDVTGCGFHAAETPFVSCDVGPPDVDGKREYTTSEVPINFDTWYSIRFDFDHSSKAIRFYLENSLIGEYALPTYPVNVQVVSGLYSPEVGQIYLDDILLTLNP